MVVRSRCEQEVCEWYSFDCCCSQWLSGADVNRRFVNGTPLIAAGVDVNRWFVNGTPLIAAVHNGCNKCAKLLIEAGTNVNKTDVNGIILLAIAARNRNYCCVNLLLEAGADVNKALTKCVLRNDVEMVKIMLSIGAKIYLSNSYGQNILNQYIRSPKSPNRTMVLCCMPQEKY